MRIEPAMRQAGMVHDRIHADRIDAVAAEQRPGRIQDPLAASPPSARSVARIRFASLDRMTIVIYSLD